MHGIFLLHACVYSTMTTDYKNGCVSAFLLIREYTKLIYINHQKKK